ncbi:MAG: iron-containing alcohol dehydrogenase [Acidimicrobiia bacterium]|nr:iron-containing alcohol dehydrogenase [Acidimicrobiia bacterium]
MRYLFERFLHAAYIAIARIAAKLLPDRIPVTFAGSDAVAELCASIGHQGVRRALVVSDAGLVEIGIVGRITEELTEAGVEWTVYSEVEPDPTFPQVETGLQVYEAEGCDAVVGVGGGSSMDAAKMIAALATNGGPLSKLEGKLRVRKAPAPLFAVPTTAGTGSEVTVAAVVSDAETHEKKFFLDPKLLPDMAALDPGLTTGLPAPITAATGMDALTHAVESFVSRASTKQTKDYAKMAVRLIFENLPKAFADGSDLAARQGMLLASYYAGLAFTRSSLGNVHAIAHNLGAAYGTPHGLANATALPHVLDFSKDDAQEQLARLAEVIGLSGDSDVEKAQQFIDAVRDLMATLEIPYELEALQNEDITSIARRARAEAFLDYPVPRFMSQSECEGLLQQMCPSRAA